MYRDSPLPFLNISHFPLFQSELWCKIYLFAEAVTQGRSLRAPNQFLIIFFNLTCIFYLHEGPRDFICTQYNSTPFCSPLKIKIQLILLTIDKQLTSCNVYSSSVPCRALVGTFIFLLNVGDFQDSSAPVVLDFLGQGFSIRPLPANTGDRTKELCLLEKKRQKWLQHRKKNVKSFIERSNVF